MSIKAIETKYRGYRFRSRLEARWAVFFDSIGIPFAYEPQGIEFEDGTRYLPDFYLPDCNQFFEVKGVMDDYDLHKVECLIKSGYSVTVGYDNGYFDACDMECDKCYSLARPHYSILAKCKKCGKYWFMGIDGEHECQCCGHHNGDKGFTIEMSFLDTILWDFAKQARFDELPKKFDFDEFLIDIARKYVNNKEELWK